MTFHRARFKRGAVWVPRSLSRVPVAFVIKRHNNHTQIHTKGNMESIKDKIQERISFIRKQQEEMTLQVERQIRWLQSNADIIERLGIVPTAYGNMIDFDHPTRDQVLQIIKAFPGRWEKSSNTVGDNIAMNYVRVTEAGEQVLRIWAGELPPSCRVVEEQVIVPERIETHKKIVCNEAQASAPTPKTAEEFAAQIILGSMTSKPA